MWKTRIKSPVGQLKAYANERALCGLLWPDSDDLRFEANRNIDQPTHPVFVELTDQLNEYFEGKRQQFDLLLDPMGTEFQVSAWMALIRIPFGQTRSYAAQAAAIGRPTASRAIGAANGKNPISIVIPCHRVIGSDGHLTGFAGGLEVKRFLLEHEKNTLAAIVLDR